jgi:hypothetical protein
MNTRIAMKGGYFLEPAETLLLRGVVTRTAVRESKANK